MACKKTKISIEKCRKYKERKRRAKRNKTRKNLKRMPRNGKALVWKMNSGRSTRIQWNARRPRRKTKREQ